MRHAFALVFALVATAPCALADIPSPEPVGNGWLPLVLAVVVAVGAALLAYTRLARRRSAGATATPLVESAAASARRKDA